ncbi:MAG: hypothetical protein LBE86_11260 [Gemmobacter sp.]|nr:hypothetical protein [Gemmobacter sp.]
MHKRTLVYSLSLTALVAGSLGTAALADRMREGYGWGMGGFDFAAADTDGDGRLTPDEMKAIRAARIADLDADKDGRISAEEMIARDMRGAETRIRARVAAMMERMDADGDGTLTAAEVLSMPMPGEQMLGWLDKDNDGAVSKAEFDAARERMHDGMSRGQRGQRGHMMHGEAPPMMGEGAN